MKIKFYNPKELDKTHKVTIQKTGKMGFTKDAAEYMKLSNMKSANIGTDEERPQDNTLYLQLYNDSHGYFAVQKAGQYYYIKTKVLFDNLKLDYTNDTVSFDMDKISVDGNTYYKLRLRKEDFENGKEEKIQEG
ncbi:MAG: hypothetical protein ACTHJN_02075 [Ginsengibacter sp.]